LNGEYDKLNLSDTKEYKNTIYYCIFSCFRATILCHIPSFIFTKIMKHCAKAEPRFNLKIYKIMRIIIIISVIYVFTIELLYGLYKIF
jgi:hypothetical protein